MCTNQLVVVRPDADEPTYSIPESCKLSTLSCLIANVAKCEKHRIFITECTIIWPLEPAGKWTTEINDLSQNKAS